MNGPWKPALVLMIVLLVAFVALIVQASLAEDVATGFGRVLEAPWGPTTLADLGLGLVFAGVWIAVLEGARRAWPWWLGLVFLGNAALLMFLIARLLRRRNLRALFLP